MKFTFSVTVTDNEIIRVIIKQSLRTRNVRKLSNNCQLMEKYKTDLIARSAFLLISIQNLNNNYNNLLYINDFNKERELIKVLIPVN